MSNNKRKKYFIDRKVQGALIRRMMWHYAIFLVTCSAFAFLLQFLANPMDSFQSHVDKLRMTQGPFLVVALFILPIFIRDTIKLSHRFVGPILRVRNTMQQAGRGDNTALVKLRPGDFWIDLADDLNGLLTRMRSEETKSAPTEEAVS